MPGAGTGLGTVRSNRRVKPSFLADQCIPFSVIQSLKEADYRTTQVREVLPIRAPDPEVIEKAQELDSVLLSLDGDFADIVLYPPARFGGIITLQFHNHPEVIPSVVQNLLSYLRDYPDREDYRAKLLIIESHWIRIRTK